jgi:hypothetical protein
MRKLTEDQTRRKADLASHLFAGRDSVNAALNEFNRHLEDQWLGVETEIQNYNELVQSAQGFIEEVQGDQEAYADQRSETWKESGSGQAYESWQSEWGLSIEECGLVAPEKVEMESLDGAEVLQALPDSP